ncbi:MAG: phosphoglycerate kinase [Pseudomonadota bacterium]
MPKSRALQKLPLLQDADLSGKIVLVRVDHNVVKSGMIKDPYRIDQTLGTIYNIVERGGRSILMTHVGRPRDKKTGGITCDDSTCVRPIVKFLERKLHTEFYIPEIACVNGKGILAIDTSINHAVKKLKDHKIGAIYLPNTRWFRGEEGSSVEREAFSLQLAGLADVYVNDAFGSWQPHASTYDITKHIPSYAGFLMQGEIEHLIQMPQPERPFVAVVAGAKYDTKIGPLNEIYNKVDHLILGGVIYNAYLCAKYGIHIAGISDTDVEMAKKLVELDKKKKKIGEMPYLIESDIINDGRVEGRYRTVNAQGFEPGKQYGYFLDVAAGSFDDPVVKDIFASAKTVFVNAVMGMTPHFSEGSEALYKTIDENRDAIKLYGGGDTLQEFKRLCPGLYLTALDDVNYYCFTGGGAVLKAIEENTPFGIKPVEALVEAGQRGNR